MIGLGLVVIDPVLKMHGPTKASQIAQRFQDPKAREILYRNVYGWLTGYCVACMVFPPAKSTRLFSGWKNRMHIQCDVNPSEIFDTVQSDTKQFNTKPIADFGIYILVDLLHEKKVCCISIPAKKHDTQRQKKDEIDSCILRSFSNTFNDMLAGIG
jgi:hypothetical protein